MNWLHDIDQPSEKQLKDAARELLSIVPQDILNTGYNGIGSYLQRTNPAIMNRIGRHLVPIVEFIPDVLNEKKLQAAATDISEQNQQYKQAADQKKLRESQLADQVRDRYIEDFIGKDNNTQVAPQDLASTTQNALANLGARREALALNSQNLQNPLNQSSLGTGNTTESTPSNSLDIRAYQQLPAFGRNDAVGKLVNKLVNDYKTSEGAIDQLIEKGDIENADKLLSFQRTLEPYIEPLLKLGHDYYNATDTNNTQLQKTLQDEIFSLGYKAIQLEPFDSEIESEPLGARNTFLPKDAENIKLSGISDVTSSGHPKWMQEANLNLHNELEKNLEARPFFPKPRPVIGPSNIRTIADKQAMKNLQKQDVAGDFAAVKQGLKGFSDSNSELYRKLTKEASASPFDTSPFANVNANAGKESGSSSGMSYLDQYMNPYRKHVLDDAMLNLEKEYREKTLPLINHQLSMRGGLSSGYRNGLLMKALKDLQEKKRITRNELNYKGYADALNEVKENRALALQGVDRFGTQELSALERRAKLPQQEALAQNLNAHTLNQIASEQEAFAQNAANAKHEHELDAFNAPLRKTTTVLDSLNKNKPVSDIIRRTPPEVPKASAKDMLGQILVTEGIRGQFAEGGSVTDDDYLNKIKDLANYYRSQPQPNALKEMLLDSIANMYSGSSKYISDNVTANMPNMLAKSRALEAIPLQNEAEALKLDMLARKAKAEDEDRRLANEEFEFNKSIKNQHLDLEREKLDISGDKAIKLSPQQETFNNKIIKESMDKAQVANESLKQIDLLYKAFEKFDKYSSKFTQAGDFTTSEFAKKYGSLRLMQDKQRAAAQEIAKVKGKLAEVMFKGGLGSRLGVNSEEEIRAALPDIGLLPEARVNILKSITSMNSEDKLRNQFYSKWRQMNKDMTGADIAFDTYKDSLDVFDERGFIKKDAMKQIENLFSEQPSEEASQEMGNIESSKQGSKQLSTEDVLNFVDEIIKQRQEEGLM